jgi:hypothetical protein
MPIPPYPYRHLSFTLPPPPAVDPLGRATAVARLFVLLWSALRDVTSFAHGFDFETFLAATIVALTLVFRAKGPLP